MSLARSEGASHRSINMRILTLVPLALLAFGCTDDDDGNIVVVPPPDDTGGDELPPPSVIEWRADITSNDPFIWSLFGTGNVIMNNGEAAFTASVDIRNDEVGVERPWHVHLGTCGSGGPIVGDDTAYPRLFTGPDGASAVAVTIRGLGLDPNASYHINIHESDFYFTTLIACGDLIIQ
jgi:hypothetical protein